MSIIDRYVARTFLSGYLILMLVGIGLYTLTDLLVNVDEFAKDETLSLLQVLRLMADYYLCNLPLYYSQLGGPLMAIAAAFTLGMMLRNNELTALVAAGMPLQRLAVPIAACSVLLVAAWMANRELLLPRLAHKIARKHDDVISQRQQQRHPDRRQLPPARKTARESLHHRAGRRGPTATPDRGRLRHLRLRTKGLAARARQTPNHV
jgi:lipopolysaccharide export LptBFGC system permease protein LptF